MNNERVAQWLRETRLRQVMPGTRKPWSQDYLLDQMRATGWAPHRPNYSKYETGKAHPEPDTLDKFVAFWAARGETGPDLSPVAESEPEPSLAAALSELAAELAAVRLEREAWQRGVLAVLRSYRAGQVPVELLDALVPQPLEDAPR